MPSVGTPLSVFRDSKDLKGTPNANANANGAAGFTPLIGHGCQQETTAFTHSIAPPGLSPVVRSIIEVQPKRRPPERIPVNFHVCLHGETYGNQESVFYYGANHQKVEKDHFSTIEKDKNMETGAIYDALKAGGIISFEGTVIASATKEGTLSASETVLSTRLRKLSGEGAIDSKDLDAIFRVLEAPHKAAWVETLTKEGEMQAGKIAQGIKKVIEKGREKYVVVINEASRVTERQALEDIGHAGTNDTIRFVCRDEPTKAIAETIKTRLIDRGFLGINFTIQVLTEIPIALVCVDREGRTGQTASMIKKKLIEFGFKDENVTIWCDSDLKDMGYPDALKGESTQSTMSKKKSILSNPEFELEGWENFYTMAQRLECPIDRLNQMAAESAKRDGLVLAIVSSSTWTAFTFHHHDDFEPNGWLRVAARCGKQQRGQVIDFNAPKK